MQVSYYQRISDSFEQKVLAYDEDEYNYIIYNINNNK